MSRALCVTLLLLIGSNAYAQAPIRTQRLTADTVIVKNILQLPAGSYNTATLNADGDSIKIFAIGGISPYAKVILSWQGVGYLGELSVRNLSPSGFTIFSNTDEQINIEVIYLILDNKILLP